MSFLIAHTVQYIKIRLPQVYVVWPHTGTRLSSKAYCLCLFMMLGYFVVTVLMMIGEVLHHFFLDKLLTLMAFL